MDNAERATAEMKMAVKIIDAFLAAGYKLGVYDEEALELPPTTKREDIVQALAHSDLNVIEVYLAAIPGPRIGYINLIWGNGPEDLVSDYTWTNAINHILENLQS